MTKEDFRKKLYEAFAMGQQWMQDLGNQKEPENFNDWFESNYARLASDGDLADVSGFTAADMERAYNDGKADGTNSDIPFNIEYYR